MNCALSFESYAFTEQSKNKEFDKNRSKMNKVQVSFFLQIFHFRPNNTI